ncbi:MAG: putative lyase [Phycisphaerales bacterium]|nr:putative lyase [Phycisphaerales bacterium]
MRSRLVFIFLLLVVMSFDLPACMRAEPPTSQRAGEGANQSPEADAAAAVLRNPHSSEEQLLAACDALRDLGPSVKAGIPALYGVLDKGVTVRHRALDALAAVGGEPALETAKSFAHWYGREAVETRLADLKAAKALGDSGMLKLLEDPKPEERARAARMLALSRTGKPEAIDLLVARLNDDNFAARHAAAEAIKALRPRMNGSAIEAMVDRLDREQIRVAEADAAVKQAVAEAEHNAAEQAAANDRAAVDDYVPPAETARDVTWELPRLIERLGNKDDEVRLQALQNLRRTSGMTSAWRDVGKLAVKDPNPSIRQLAVETLAEIGWHANEGLFEALKSKDSEVRKLAVVATGPRESPGGYDSEVAATMNHAALDADAGVRRSATLWLARFDPNGPKRPTVFIELMDSADVRERRLGASVLGQRHDAVQAVVPTWIHALEDSDPEVQVAAISWLAGLGDDAKGAESRLKEIVAKSARTAARPAAILLLRMGAESRSTAVAYLVKALETGAAEEKVQVVRALATVGADAKPAVPALLATLAEESNELRIDVAQTLGAIGPDAKAALPALTRMADNRHIDVRSAAVAALAKIDPEGRSLAPALFAAVLNKDRTACGVLAGPMKKTGTPREVFRRLETIATDDPDDGVRETARMVAEQLGPGPTLAKGTQGQKG